MEGANIETAIKDIRGTSVAHLEPNRTNQNKKQKNTLPSNSNLFKCTWSLEELMKGYILAREIANIGE
ncbi:15533_t:CDS:2 [Gigaspora rosea]|nr:15533_t:CDS:2 [Gigaspora rosea]